MEESKVFKCSQDSLEMWEGVTRHLLDGSYYGTNRNCYRFTDESEQFLQVRPNPDELTIHDRKLMFSRKGFEKLMAKEEFRQTLVLNRFHFWGSVSDFLKQTRGKLCEECGEEKHLEIHHIIPQRNGGLDDTENLKILCQHCHRKYTTNQYSEML